MNMILLLTRKIIISVFEIKTNHCSFIHYILYIAGHLMNNWNLTKMPTTSVEMLKGETTHPTITWTWTMRMPGTQLTEQHVMGEASS
jgi:hypothetical protein